jgi:hypothetical protein
MTKKPQNTKVPAKGGWVARSAVSGRFVEVCSERGVSKSSPKSEAAASKASSKRSAALKRLADR